MALHLQKRRNKRRQGPAMRPGGYFIAGILYFFTMRYNSSHGLAPTNTVHTCNNFTGSMEPSAAIVSSESESGNFSGTGGAAIVSAESGNFSGSMEPSAAISLC
jgi:hypothetical protein